MSFSVDHHGFYREEVPFYPITQGEEANTVLIKLAAGQALEKAEEAVAQGRWILWELDLGLSSAQLTPEILSNPSALFLGIEEFCSQLLPSFKDFTFGVVLYRQERAFIEQFPPDLWKEEFEQTSCPGPEPYLVFCATLLSEFLHRQVSLLPDTLLAFALFDAAPFSSFALMAHLFLHERFEYLNLMFLNVPALYQGSCSWGPDGKRSHFSKEILWGLLLPCDSFIDISVLSHIDRAAEELQRKNIPFRLIAEERLTEQWDGLDQILVPSLEAISPQARRKLLGFVAAGGKLIGAEGFEPPTHCSQSSCASQTALCSD